MRTLAWLILFPSLAHAQLEGVRIRSGDDVISARACIGETGWSDPEGCTAVLYVHAERARRSGLSVGTMARLYSAALRHPRRLWVTTLADSPRVPTGWPPGLPWAPYRRRFVSVLAHVRRVLGGEIRNPCPGALHYGAERDGVPRGFVLSVCVESKQRFYVRLQ